MRKRLLILWVMMLSMLIGGCQEKASTSAELRGLEVYKIIRTEGVQALSFGGYDDKNSQYINGKKVDLARLKLEDKPVFTDKDIKRYDWSHQRITFTDAYLNSTGRKAVKDAFVGGCGLVGGGEFDAYMVVLNGERIYAFGFPLAAMRSMCNPEILMEDLNENTVRIINQRKGDDDTRDKRLYEYLKKQGRLVE